MKICSLASGSSGNCVYVGHGNTHLLIDAGLSGKAIKEGLANVGVDIATVSGLLITHEHSDHIKGVGVLARKYGFPIYTKPKTFETLLSMKSMGIIDPDLLVPVQEDHAIRISEIMVMPFASSHDAVDPLCYTFEAENKKISVATDLGNYSQYIIDHLSGSNVLYIEANHDIRMLEVGPYPFFLKQRILSDLGHLSNERSGQLLCELYHDDLTHVILAHLSHENNMPQVAFESVKYELTKHLGLAEQDLAIHVAQRHTNSVLVEI